MAAAAATAAAAELGPAKDPHVIGFGDKVGGLVATLATPGCPHAAA
jgi:hypothetical protein